MDAVTRLRHGRGQTKQTVGLWIGLVTVHTFTSSVTLKPECVPCGGAGLQAQFSGGLLHEPEWFEPYDQKRCTASSDSPVLSRRFHWRRRPRLARRVSTHTTARSPTPICSMGPAGARESTIFASVLKRREPIPGR